MLVLEQPEVGAVEESADDFSDEALTSLWQQAAKLRAARLAHGAFNLSNVLATACAVAEDPSRSPVARES
jgi:hypothetical protein